jgi:hypothetical protein
VSIVTLPCDIGGHRAVSFEVIGVYRDRVFLVDLCANWNAYASVIDAAREVFQHCNAMYGSKRVICEEARWRWREIIHQKGAMSNAPYDDRVPLKIIWKSLVAGQRRSMPVGGV